MSPDAGNGTDDLRAKLAGLIDCALPEDATGLESADIEAAADALLAAGWRPPLPEAEADLLGRFVAASLEFDYTAEGDCGGDYEDDGQEREAAIANIVEMHRLLNVRAERLAEAHEKLRALSSPMPDGETERPPAPAAGNCVGRLCAYERALTEEYPDGIEEHSETLPDPVRAAKRVGDFLRSYGDGRVCVAITPLAEYQIPPLYGRDLQALANLVDREPPAPRVFFPGDTVPDGMAIQDDLGDVHRSATAEWCLDEESGWDGPAVEIPSLSEDEWQAAVDRARAAGQHTEGTQP